MSESPPRGAERDLFRDTWVRYLGESGTRGTAPTPTTTWLGKRGLPDSVRRPGGRGRIFVPI